VGTPTLPEDIKGEIHMTEVFRLEADEHRRDGYGRNSAVSNGIIAVAAHARGTDNKGAVDLYHKQSGQWVKFKELTASDGQAEDQFGTSVDLDGDILVVGAQGDDDAAELAGATYVFERNVGGADNWGETAKFTPEGAQIRDTVGGNVSVDGNLVASGTSRSNATDGIPGFVEVFELEASSGDGTQWEIDELSHWLFNMANNIAGWKMTSWLASMGDGSPYMTDQVYTDRDAHLTQGKKQCDRIAAVILEKR